jgi:hypothetical protein
VHEHTHAFRTSHHKYLHRNRHKVVRRGFLRRRCSRAVLRARAERVQRPLRRLFELGLVPRIDQCLTPSDDRRACASSARRSSMPSALLGYSRVQRLRTHLGILLKILLVGNAASLLLKCQPQPRNRLDPVFEGWKVYYEPLVRGAREVIGLAIGTAATHEDGIQGAARPCERCRPFN